MTILMYFLLSFISSVLYDRRTMRRTPPYWYIGLLCMGIGLITFGCIVILLLFGWQDADIPAFWWRTASIFIFIGLLLGIPCRFQDKTRK